VEVILTHESADFDALAAAVAAQLRFPEARVLLPRSLGRDVRAYVALHRERIRAVRPEEVDPARVTRLVLVDVRRASRLKDHAALLARAFARDPALSVHVYDHHAASDDDVPAEHVRVERVGSATTLLLEELRAEDVALDPIEATLFALGIHVDTGSLTYASSTHRDAEALAWAMARGASLAVLRRYLDSPFSPAQRELLRDCLETLRVEQVGAARIGVVTAERIEGVEGVDEVASELLALHDLHALFVLVRTGRRVQVVARSRAPFVDVSRALAAVGGGGHRAAASGVAKHGDLGAVERDLLGALSAEPPSPSRVSELMSSPAVTVQPSFPLASLAPLLARHHGLPVVERGALVGVVSRRDLARAEREGLLHRPVSTVMTRAVVTTTQETSLEDAAAAMTRADVGRLPVMREGELVGVIARSDVLAALYGSRPDDQ
jgi:tRNA nucleotidyltransferase (CCA-adding enzyme)